MAVRVLTCNTRVVSRLPLAGPSPRLVAGRQARDRRRQTPGETDGFRPRHVGSTHPQAPIHHGAPQVKVASASG